MKTTNLSQTISSTNNNTSLALENVKIANINSFDEETRNFYIEKFNLDPNSANMIITGDDASGEKRVFVFKGFYPIKLS